MSFLTRRPGEIIIAESPNKITFGTCMLGNVWGEVESATVSRTADIEEIEKCGGDILAVILRKMRFELKFKILLRADAAPPQLAQLIEFPYAGVKGRILPPIDIGWEKAGHQTLDITAMSWDVFRGNNQGGGAAQHHVEGIYTNIDPA